MSLIVQKYGGTSVGTTELILEVTKIIQEFYLKGNQLVVVFSAMMGETNRLLNLAKKISFIHHKSELDILASTGEQVTIALISMALKDLGLKVKSYCGWQIPIITTNDFTNSRIKTINTSKIIEDLNNNYIVIITGFQGVTQDGEITTLGRGGSDTSAVALAVALKANECQIYTDVDGVYNADPHKIASAKKIDVVDGACMLEAASLGTKILQVRSCELAYRYKTNIRILSTFSKQNLGTLVMNESNLENYPIISISTEEYQVLVTIKTQEKMNELLSDIYKDINIDMLSINQHGIIFVTNKQFVNELTSILDKYKIKDITITEELIKISLIGSGFRSNQKLNQQIWQLINGVDILATSHNEISISFIVNYHNAKNLTNIFSSTFCNS
ncbi:MAG TPA: aspartate kinase [Burkholderiales bacterium]|nr:aspartate kinase [Burkholderiales bacterium]